MEYTPEIWYCTSSWALSFCLCEGKARSNPKQALEIASLRSQRQIVSTIMKKDK